MSIPVISEAPEKWPLPATRCIFRGHLMDYETAAFLMAMESKLGYTLTVLQGSYNTSVSASAGTHAGGGAIDLAPWDWENKVRVARELGAAAWHRLPIPDVWGEHIHFIIRNHPTLSDAAKAQQRDYDANPPRDGLADHAVDRTWHPNPKVTFKYPPKAPATPTFRGVSLNDDWGNLASDVAGTVEQVRPLVMGVQEGWRVHYRTELDKRWGVGQLLENDSTAGVAVIWDRRRIDGIGHSGNPARLGHGWQAIGKGADTRIRGVKWRDLQFKPGVDRGALPARFRLASLHRPPMRNRASWEKFDQATGLWLRRSPLPVVLFMDCNEHGGPEGLMSSISARYKWVADGGSIDGAVTALPTRGVKELPTPTSDHDAAVVTLG